MQKIRNFLVVSLLSFVLVSIPNSISLFSEHFGKVADLISKPATWLSCLNSGVNILVYIALIDEVRHQFLYLIGRRAARISGEPSSSHRRSTLVITRTQ
ncbi:unnamed protein product [Caenorhabditis bovis]|uniref:Uncharacterized protein n=1 Tax=Caenorhabditis bovis TaxID=2654633 RepID=A0A8S1EVH7_9PELO|nr:unnamed protein product [Caenorhabditis bovis]